MNIRIQKSNLDPISLEEYGNSNYLAVLAKVRNKTNASKISELTRDENQKAVRKTIREIDSKAFTAQQWRVAAYYLTGLRLDVSSSELLKNIILHELN